MEDITADAASILSEVIAGFDDQVAAYNEALTTYLQDPDDIEAMNEVMRIAYNFSDGLRN